MSRLLCTFGTIFGVFIIWSVHFQHFLFKKCPFFGQFWSKNDNSAVTLPLPSTDPFFKRLCFTNFTQLYQKKKSNLKLKQVVESPTATQLCILYPLLIITFGRKWNLYLFRLSLKTLEVLQCITKLLYYLYYLLMM